MSKYKQPLWFRLLMIIAGIGAMLAGLILIIFGLVLVPYSSPLIVVGAFTAIGGFVLFSEKVMGKLM